MGITSCSSKKFLSEDEYLLKKNEIRIEGKSLSNSEKTRLRDLAFTRIALKPNSNYFFFFPKERAALKHRFATDTSKFAAFAMKILDGEQPSLIDSNRIEAVASNLTSTLQSEGYFDGRTEYKINYGKKRKKKLVGVTYTLIPKQVYRLDSFKIKSVDTLLLRALDTLQIPTRFKKGVPVSAKLRNEEAQRISSALRNQGYYDFSPAQFSRFIARDTTDHEVDMDFVIYPPSDDSIFRKYTIGEIYLYPNYDSDQPESVYQDTFINGYHFKTLDGNLIVKPKLIAQKIAVNSGDFYTYRDFRKTILQLNTIDIFKTPRISIRKRDDGSALLDYHIYLFKERKYEDEVGVENFVSSLSQGSLLLGASLHAGRRIKNAFNGSETISLNLDGSIETAFAGSSNNNDIITLGIGVDVNTPRYKDLVSLSAIRLVPGLGKLLISDKFMRDLNALGSQSLRLSFDYVDFESFYSSTSIIFSRGVTLNRDNHNYSFVFQEFNLFSPDTVLGFTDRIGQNQVFRRSFNKQLITGILFRSFNYSYSSPITNKRSYDIFVNLEASGLVISGLDAIPGINLRSINFNGEQFNFSQFAKVEFEPKYTYYFNDKSSLAFRLGLGVAFPYGTGISVPYNELFSLGGSYSLRGWRNRDVGPGKIDNSNNTIPFAADQFKFELSSEYRFDLGWILEGALFAEAGNVWNISDATSETQIDIETLAVDAGLGIRFDLTFFLFRFDTAFKVRNWYPDPATDKYWNTSSFRQLTNNPNFTIGINYPF